MKQLNKRHLIFLVLVILAALFCRLFYLVQYSESPLFANPLGPDVEEYDLWARNMMSGQILWKDVHIHAPLYPFTLSVFYRIFSMNFMLVRFFQLFAGFLAAIPIFFVMKRIPQKDDSSAFSFVPEIFLVFFAVYPPLLFYQGELISEALVMPLICLILAALYMAENSEKTVSSLSCFAVAGLLSGLAAVAHPVSMLFIGFEGIYLLVMGIIKTKKDKQPILKGIIPVLLFGCLAALSVLPVSMYNTYLSEKLVLVQKNSAFNFYLGNNENADGTCYLRPGPSWDKVHGEANLNRIKTGEDNDSFFLKKSFHFIKDNPGRWMGLLISKAFYALNFRELTAGADVGPIRFFTPFQRYSYWSSGLLYLLAVSGLILMFVKRKFLWDYRHFLFLMVAYWLAQTLFAPSGRYRFPSLPAVFVFAAFFAAYLIENFKDKKETALALLFLLISGLIVFLPAPPINTKSERAEADTILGEAYMKSGNLVKAKELFERSIQGLPGWTRTYDTLGTLYAMGGDFKGAEKMHLKAIACDPHSTYSYMNLAVLYSNSGRMADAEKYLNLAMERGDSKLPDLSYNRGYFYHKSGNLKEAERLYKECLEEEPSNRKALNALGVVLLMTKRPKEAIIFFSKALALEPENPGIMASLGLAYMDFNDTDNASYYYKKASAITPEHPAVKLLGQRLSNHK